MKRGRKSQAERAALAARLVDPRQPWQIAQGRRCPCRGTDDYCQCQNADEPWKYGLGGSPPPTREQELERRVRELEGHVRTLELQQQTDRQTIAALFRNQESGSVEPSSSYPFCRATRREACIVAGRCTADPVCND